MLKRAAMCQQEAAIECVLRSVPRLQCSDIVALLPLGYRFDLTSAHLFFPLVPTLGEPIWVIDWDGATFQIGAYTGVLYIKPGK